MLKTITKTTEQLQAGDVVVYLGGQFEVGAHTVDTHVGNCKLVHPELVFETKTLVKAKLIGNRKDFKIRGIAGYKFQVIA